MRMADELLVVSRAAFSGHLGSVLAVAVTPDGEEIITAGNDGTARAWNRRSGEQCTTLTAHTDWVRAVAVTPDGEEIITTGDDRTIRIWNRRRGVQARGTQLGGSGPARQLAAVRSDEPSAEDLLDFAGEVEMLAALAASLTTEPPLSVALLGEWGAGKSSEVADCFWFGARPSRRLLAGAGPCYVGGSRDCSPTSDRFSRSLLRGTRPVHSS
jgi:WD40 repeat protein